MRGESIGASEFGKEVGEKSAVEFAMRQLGKTDVHASWAFSPKI